MTERYSAEHYIIVRVREKHPVLGTSALGRVRKAIREVATEYDLLVSDVPVRGDRYDTYYGGYGYWRETAEIFHNLMSRAKDAARRRQSSCGRDCRC